MIVIPEAELANLVHLAQELRDQVWQGRDLDAIPDDQLTLATVSRELWQELSGLYLEGTL